MKPIVRQCFHDVYGEYLKSHGFIKKREVYYKIDWEKKFIYHVGLIIFKGGHDFDVFMGMDPFCSFEYEFPCESNMRVGDFCNWVLNKSLSWVYERNIEEDIMPKIQDSFYWFCKIGKEMNSHIYDIASYYNVKGMIYKILYQQEIIGYERGVVALKCHLYQEAKKHYSESLVGFKNIIATRKPQYDEWVNQYGKEYVIKNYYGFYRGYMNGVEGKQETDYVLKKLEEKDYDALDKLIEEREKQTEEKIYAYFGNKIRPESSKE